MKNKRGLIRIVEASIAILVIFSVLFILFVRDGGVEQEDLTNLISPLLKEIAQDNSIRMIILDGGTTGEEAVEAFISDKIDSLYDYEVKICEPTAICPIGAAFPTGIDTEIYSAERIISTNFDSSGFAPKKVKIFLWRK